jgi:hypothetical protein
MQISDYEKPSIWLASLKEYVPNLYEHISYNLEESKSKSLAHDVMYHGIRDHESYLKLYNVDYQSPEVNVSLNIIFLSLLAYFSNYKGLSLQDYKTYIKSYGKFDDLSLPTIRNYGYLELYVYDDNKMFFYVGKGKGRRVAEHTANGGAKLFSNQYRLKVFSIPVLALLDFPLIPNFYELLFYSHFQKLCEDLSTDFPFSFSFNLFNYKYEYDVDLFCSNKSGFTRELNNTAFILGRIHQKYFSTEFNKISGEISDLIKNTLTHNKNYI